MSHDNFFFEKIHSALLMSHFDCRHVFKKWISWKLSLCISDACTTFCICLRKLYGEKYIAVNTLKRGNQILIPLHMRAVILERIDHRRRILIKCQERCRDAIWWSNFSQAVKRNVSSLQEAQTLWALRASHHGSMGCAPMVKAGRLLWWLKNLSH